MKLLLDTHILLWGAVEPESFPTLAVSLIENPDNEVVFSAVSLWEIAIKTGRGRDDFRIDAGQFRRSLLDNGYLEIPVTGVHAAAVANLPLLHKDPFDRMLVAQAISEGLTLVTVRPGHREIPGTDPAGLTVSFCPLSRQRHASGVKQDGRIANGRGTCRQSSWRSRRVSSFSRSRPC